MTRPMYFAALALFLFAADNHEALPWRTVNAPEPSAFAGQTVPILPDLTPQQSSQQTGQQVDASTATPSAGSKNAAGPWAKKAPDLDPTKPLDPDARLELLRYVDGEFASARQSLPTGRDGFIMQVGKPLDAHALRIALARHGAAFNPGDQVQITAVRFRSSQIIFDLNGGGKQKTHWRDHIQVGMGGDVPMMTSTTEGLPGAAPEKVGSTLVLDFGKPVPEMTPDELKADLRPVLEFSPRSAATQWIDTLPPEFQKAIADKRPLVGMTREMVIAAIGKPDRKVRETGQDGIETEDWIYGTPPAKTVFVTFVREKVVRVEQFPQ
jgi:hypothetical protein